MGLKHRIVAAVLLTMLGVLPAMAVVPCLADCASADAAEAAVLVGTPVGVSAGHCQGRTSVAISTTACDPHSPLALQSSGYVSPKFQNVGVEPVESNDSLIAAANLSRYEPAVQSRFHSRQNSPLVSLRI